jgi:hypothetical protein
MSENTINTIADQTAAALESTKSAKAPKHVEQVEQVNVTPTADQVVEALLAQFAESSMLTAYQIHVVANLAFEILGITVIDRDGVEQVKQIAPQYVYNKTKAIRASKGQDARFDLDEAANVISSIVGGTKSTVTSKDRIDTNALRAQALKALKG